MESSESSCLCLGFGYTSVCNRELLDFSIWKDSGDFTSKVAFEGDKRPVSGFCSTTFQNFDSRKILTPNVVNQFRWTSLEPIDFNLCVLFVLLGQPFFLGGMNIELEQVFGGGACSIMHSLSLGINVQTYDIVLPLNPSSSS